MDDAAILILAAGASSRMRGRDKLLEEVEGEPLLARQVRVAAATGRPVHVALRPRDDARRAVIGDAAAIEVPDAHLGLARSIAAGLAALAGAPAVLLLPGDMPALTTGDLLAVLTAPRGSDEVVRAATAAGAPGHPVLVPASAHPRFAGLMGRRRPRRPARPARPARAPAGWARAPRSRHAGGLGTLARRRLRQGPRSPVN